MEGPAPGCTRLSVLDANTGLSQIGLQSAPFQKFCLSLRQGFSKMSWLLSACALAVSLAGPLVASSATASGATEVVERFQSTLISVMMNARKLGYTGRFKRLKPAVEETHDLPAIARIAAGPYWDQLGTEQKKLYVEAFSELSIATYAGRFDGYSGETFRIISERRLDNGDALVQSVLFRPGGKQIRFDYVLRQKEGRWAMINIIVDGVSDLAIKRSEYAVILRSEGAEALIEKLRSKVAQYANAPETKK